MNRVKRKLWELRHPEEAKAKARRKTRKVKQDLDFLQKMFLRGRGYQLWKG